MNLVKSSLPLMVAAAALGLGACNDRALPSTSSAVGAAPNEPGSTTSDSTPTSTCKASTSETGLPCKICVDGSGMIFYDDCGSGGAGGVSGGSGGSTGTGGTVVKCIPTTDPTTGASCQTCYNPDGSYTATCGAPPSGCVDASGKNTCGTGGTTGAGATGGTEIKCIPTTDPTTGAACKTCYFPDGSVANNSCSGGAGGSGGTETGGTGGTGGTGVTVKCLETADATGAACKICYAADGSITTDTCSSSGSGGVTGTGTGGTGVTVKCAETTDPTTGADCKTCYAADGSITSSTCSGGGVGGATGSGGVGGSGATCVGAPNLETGQICKVCSDSVSGALLFVDCGPAICPSSPGTTAPTPPPAK